MSTADATTVAADVADRDVPALQEEIRRLARELIQFAERGVRDGLHALLRAGCSGLDESFRGLAERAPRPSQGLMTPFSDFLLISNAALMRCSCQASRHATSCNALPPRSACRSFSAPRIKACAIQSI